MVLRGLCRVVEVVRGCFGHSENNCKMVYSKRVQNEMKASKDGIDMPNSGSELNLALYAGR